VLIHVRHRKPHVRKRRQLDEIHTGAEGPGAWVGRNELQGMAASGQAASQATMDALETLAAGGKDDKQKTPGCSLAACCMQSGVSNVAQPSDKRPRRQRTSGVVSPK
jgi:hypothetical protein